MTNFLPETAASNGPSTISSRATRLASLFPAFAGSLLTVATFVGFALHLAGDVAYTTYLTQMGLEPTSFPQAADWKITHGLFVALNQAAFSLGDMPIGRIAVVLIVLSIPLVVAGAPAKKNAMSRGWIAKIPYWVRQPFVVYFFLVSVLATAATVGSLLLLGSTAPGIIGERFGATEAAEHMGRLKREQLKAESQLWKDGKQLMRGEIIVTNADLIALYDMDTEAMRTVPRDGAEVRASLGRSSYANPEATPSSK